MHYDLTTLPNGLRIISESMPSIRSVAAGCWVDTGTRDELSNEAGSSHFLEHLLFKGSEQMSARYISETFDAMGAQSNAFTSKEYTCFWARLIDDDLDTGLQLLGEMLQRPAFRPTEIDSERQVVIEEINMSEDDPQDVVFEEFTGAVFDGHPLERPILGTRESMWGMTPDDISSYWKRRYGAGSVVVAIAGSIEHEQAVEVVARHFADWSGDPVPHEHAAVDVQPHVRSVRRDTEQANIVLGGQGLGRADDRRYAYDVMNHILGGGMSSRLFQTIREDRGLAYSVYSFTMPFAETGAWGVYAGTTPDQMETVMGLIRQELDRMMQDGVSGAELERAKGNVRGGMALALEDASSRMVRLGRRELTGGDHLSVDEHLARVEAVTVESVVDVARAVLDGSRVIGAVGPFDATVLEAHLS
ncbi:MAG: insulinase family protein [Acidimicrobiia bacterium]|nr:insulinase family protein [Acidimicrobiia bacterium]